MSSTTRESTIIERENRPNRIENRSNNETKPTLNQFNEQNRLIKYREYLDQYKWDENTRILNIDTNGFRSNNNKKNYIVYRILH